MAHSVPPNFRAAISVRSRPEFTLLRRRGNDVTWVKGPRVKGFPSVELLRQVQSDYIVCRIKNEGLAFCCCPGSIYFVRGVRGNIALYIMQRSEGRSKSHAIE